MRRENFMLSTDHIRLLRLAAKHGVQIPNPDGSGTLVASNAESIAAYALELFFARPDLAGVVQHYQDRQQAFKEVDERHLKPLS